MYLAYYVSRIYYSIIYTICICTNIYIFIYILNLPIAVFSYKPDLLKLLSYMEAEMQARDVVIATLKVCCFGIS